MDILKNWYILSNSGTELQKIGNSGETINTLKIDPSGIEAVLQESNCTGGEYSTGTHCKTTTQKIIYKFIRTIPPVLRTCTLPSTSIKVINIDP